MPPKVQQKSKEQKAAAAMAGGKGRKKKWSKNKSRDKILNEVLFKEITYERIMNEVPKMKLVTTSALVERLKINGSLARAAIRELRAVADPSRAVPYFAMELVQGRSLGQILAGGKLRVDEAVRYIAEFRAKTGRRLTMSHLMAKAAGAAGR